MKENKDLYWNKKKIKIKKRRILDVLRENECETLEELKNLVHYLNSENKRLHLINVESLKKINILTVRIKQLKKKKKNYFTKNEENYKNAYGKKLTELQNQVNLITAYISSKEYEYNRLIEKQNKYFNDFFINLKKNINLIISNDSNKCENNNKDHCTSNKNDSYAKKKDSLLNIKNIIYDNDTEGTYNRKEKFNHNSINDKSTNDTANKNLVNIHNIREIKYDNQPKTLHESVKKKGFYYCNTSSDSNSYLNNQILDSPENKRGKHISNNLSIKDTSFSNIKSDSFALYNKRKIKNKNNRLNKSLMDQELNNQNMRNPKEETRVKWSAHNFQLHNIFDKELLKQKDHEKNAKKETITHQIIDHNNDIKNTFDDFQDEGEYVEEGMEEQNRKKDKKLKKNPQVELESELKNDEKNSVQNFETAINIKGNIKNLLNDNVDINYIDTLNSNSLKYIKFNTAHKEIINPRQHYVSEQKKTIDQIICL